MRAEEASQALVLWLGFGRAAWPQRDDAAIAAAVGPDRAPSVLETLRALESDFYASDYLIIAPDLVAMGDALRSSSAPAIPSSRTRQSTLFAGHTPSTGSKSGRERLGET